MLNSTTIAALAAAGLLATVAGSQAMPIANPASPSSQIIQVRQGCGSGFHRGPYGGCLPNVAPRGPWGRNACRWRRGPGGRLFRVCR